MIDATSLNKKKVNLLIKVIVLSLFVFFFYKVFLKKIDLDLVKQHLINANPIYLFIAMVFLILRILSLGYKFKIAATFFGISIPIKSYYINEFRMLFLEFVLPFPNAEDLFRIAFHKLRKVEFHQCLSIIFNMRISGIIIIAALMSGLLLQLGSNFIDTKGVVLILVFGLMLILILTYKIWLRLLLKFTKRKIWLQKLINNILDNKISTKQFIQLIIVGFVHSITSALAIYFILLAVNCPIAFYKVLLIVPAMTLSFILPLSIQGYGLPEAAMLFILIQFGVQQELATTASFIHLIFYSILILIGAIIFLVDKEYSLDLIKNQIQNYLQNKTNT